MTDISVIKMIISVAVWRIYPSWVNDKLRVWEGFGHSRKSWARLSRDDFRSKLEIISFLSRDMTFSKSFLFPALLKDLAPNIQALGLLVSTMSWRSFWKLRSVTGHFFCELRLRPRVIFENFLSFSKEPVLLPWQLWRSPGWAKHFGDGTSKTRMKTWSTSGVGEIERRRTIDRRRDWYESCAVIHCPNRKKKKHNEASVWSCVVSTLHHLQTREFWAACFRDPMSQPFCTSLLSCTAEGRSGCSAGKAKESSHPWHFRFWSLRRNELECTDLVHWKEALHRFLSRDAIIFVGSLLEKHFDDDFSADQEKEITFKRWPPGCQSWKLALALNGLNPTAFARQMFVYIWNDFGTIAMSSFTLILHVPDRFYGFVDSKIWI